MRYGGTTVPEFIVFAQAVVIVIGYAVEHFRQEFVGILDLAAAHLDPDLVLEIQAGNCSQRLPSCVIQDAVQR